MADITDVADGNCAYQVVDEIISGVVDTAGEKLYDNYVLAKVRNVALDHVMDEICSALRCVNLPHDVGEGGIAWIPDEDPECPPIDTWSRGAVPSKKKKQSFLSQIRSGDADNHSVGSRTRSSRRTHTSRRSGKKNQHADNSQARPAIIMSASSPNARPSTLVPHSGQYEEKNDELDELERIQREEQARIEQLRREQAEEDARYRALQEELKGKEYTFDSEGNLIVISRINPEKTGGLNHLLGVDRFGLEPNEPAHEDIPAVVMQEVPAEAIKKKKKKKKKRRSSAQPGKRKEVDPAHFLADPTKQPPLLSTIRLVPGVTLKEGQAAKQGPPPQEDSLHMSRSDFLQHQNRLERTGGESSFDDSIALEDLDIAAGSSKRGKKADDEEEYYDPNLELIKSSDWGANVKSEDELDRPAILPDRPGSQYMQRMELTLGRTTNKPRDRPHTKQSYEPDPSNIKLPPIKQVPPHMQSPEFMRQRKDKAFRRSRERLTVTNRSAIEQLSPKR